MKTSELAWWRDHLGLSAAQMGSAIGLSGTFGGRSYGRFENGSQPIPGYVEALFEAWLLAPAEVGAVMLDRARRRAVGIKRLSRGETFDDRAESLARRMAKIEVPENYVPPPRAQGRRTLAPLMEALERHIEALDGR